MTTRDTAPIGAPCWTDLWTSDVDGSRKFYAELFGWEAAEPSEEFGGYFMFLQNGVPVAGGMGAMGDMVPNNTWTVYMNTDDIARTVAAAKAKGATFSYDAMPVADLGFQTVLEDSNGAHLGLWQAGTFAGFTVLGEHGTPSWFELLARDYADAVAFYRDVLKWKIDVISDTEEFRYAVMQDPSSDAQLAGIGDASSMLAAGEAPYWSTYWHVDDVDKAAATATSLGGTVDEAPQDTPYGRLATLRDPSGARFKLRLGGS